jgi:predicted peptidase
MKIPLCIFTGTTILILGGCSTAQVAMPPQRSSSQMAQTFHFKKTQELNLGYLLFLPKAYGEEKDRKWPLMLFLHGAGERGTDIWKVAAHGPPKRVAKDSDFPFIIISPQCADGQVWSSGPLLGLLDDVIHHYSVDARRVYLTGLSMGGYGTWELGTTYPERFAAIAPICGGGQLISVLLSSRDKKEALESLGIWAFHGAKDPVVPVEESKRMVEAVKRAGARDVKLTVYPDAQHDSWTAAYEDPELYHWLLDHQRNSP